VDENGEPMVVYHGTPYGDIQVFDSTTSPDWYEDMAWDDTRGNYSEGVSWFSSNKMIADGYSSGVFAQKAGPWQEKNIEVAHLPLPAGTLVVVYPGNGERPIPLTEEQIQSDTLPAAVLTPSGRLKSSAQLQVHFPNGARLGGSVFQKRNNGKEPASPQFVLRAAKEIYNAPIAQRSTSRTLGLFLNIKNPQVIDMGGEFFRSMGRKADKAREQGYDGMFVTNVVDPGSNAVRAESATTYAAFSPTQIKSATANDGGYDAENPSILRAAPAPQGEPSISLSSVPSFLRALDSQPRRKKDSPQPIRQNAIHTYQSFTGNDPGGIRKGSGAAAHKSRQHGNGVSIGERVAGRLPILDPKLFERVSDAGAGEHSIFFDKASGRVVRVTKAGYVGFSGKDVEAYIQRWALSNRLFGDDAVIEGILKMPGKEDFSLVVSQPFITGRSSTAEDEALIRDYLLGRGFSEHDGYWIHPYLGIEVRDAGTDGNAIITENRLVSR
jgi:hypothetical protein